jgi:hypothetical protein
MYSVYKYLTALFLGCLISGFTSGGPSTEKQRQIYYNFNLHSGTALPHNDMLIYLNREYIRGLETNIWFGNPDAGTNTDLGAGYVFSNLGNRNVFGHIHAAYLSILNPLGRSNFSPDLKINLGMAWATKRYDPHDNPFNRGIGSHLNMYGQLAAAWKIPLADERWVLRPGFSFHHVSNGTVVSPNSGINMFTLHAGLDFRSGHTHRGTFTIERDTEPEGKNRFSVILAPGIKQMDRRIDKQIFTSSLVVDYGYRFLPELSIGMGAGFFYNDTWAYHPYFGRDESLSPYQTAVHISVQRDMGPLAFFMHPGTYIRMPAREIPYFTGRLGVRYKFANNLTASFAIKHHWFAIADYFEWGIGYEFNR